MINGKLPCTWLPDIPHSLARQKCTRLKITSAPFGVAWYCWHIYVFSQRFYDGICETKYLNTFVKGIRQTMDGQGV